MIKHNNISTITAKSKDGYEKKSWLDEADRHLESATRLRNVRKRRRAAYKKHPKLSHVKTMEAAVHSSSLLVAYALELYLKAGLVPLYRGCSKQLFQKEVRGRFGHDLVKLAKEIEFNLSPQTKKQLKRAESIIRSEGRYPFLSLTDKEQTTKVQTRSLEFWDDHNFHELVELAKTLSTHSAAIDQDTTQPVWFQAFKIDSDGYFTFRIGGRISPRIIVRYSSLQRQLKRNNKRNLRSLVVNNSNPVTSKIISKYWDEARYRIVKV